MKTYERAGRAAPQATPTAAWNKQHVLAQAAQYLASGGDAARRELVATTLGIQQLLRSAI